MLDNPLDFFSGNIAQASPEKTTYRDWAFGDFVTWARKRGNQLTVDDARGQFGLRYSESLEVKWSHHPAYEPRPGGWADPGTGFTLGILISGRFLIQFRKPNSTVIQEVTLTRQGDSVAWRSAAFEHTWKALEESEFLTVRWQC
jgi:hypothetical protein